jgi:septal ring factor EnvC (AmiA/AmiB activator)
MPTKEEAKKKEPTRKTKRVYNKACMQCSQAHAACDTGRPCTRCLENGLVCCAAPASQAKRGRKRALDRMADDFVKMNQDMTARVGTEPILYGVDRSATTDALYASLLNCNAKVVSAISMCKLNLEVSRAVSTEVLRRYAETANAYQMNGTAPSAVIKKEIDTHNRLYRINNCYVALLHILGGVPDSPMGHVEPEKLRDINQAMAVLGETPDNATAAAPQTGEPAQTDDIASIFEPEFIHTFLEGTRTREELFGLQAEIEVKKGQEAKLNARVSAAAAELKKIEARISELKKQECNQPAAKRPRSAPNTRALRMAQEYSTSTMSAVLNKFT